MSKEPRATTKPAKTKAAKPKASGTKSAASKAASSERPTAAASAASTAPASSPARPPLAAAGALRAKVRMYRQGLGDCHLIRLYGADPENPVYTIMIDCGVVLGTPDPASRMRSVVQDIASTTKGRVDLLIVTHEHWDHLSGFIQARSELEALRFGATWFAWTEDPDDPLANTLRAEKGQAIAGLRLAAARMAASGEEGSLLDSLVGSFGAAHGATTSDALKVVREFGAPITYHRPNDAPVPIPGLPGVRLFVLGPPPDVRALKRTLPSKSGQEGYGLALGRFTDHLMPALDGSDDMPFDPRYRIPNEVAREIDFFSSRYWAAGELDEGWRRIDAAWLAGAEELALQLDNMTNNTSLVLAIELEAEGDVLMFVGDAQVGNWLSWQDLTWLSAGGTPVTGPDLVGRTILYKVGHHGSHNATLRTKGLELMKALKTALVPVDHEMAKLKHWGMMPLPAILEALETQTKGRVFRSDMPSGTPVPNDVVATELYFEVSL